jgi:hypothetical protein
MRPHLGSLLFASTFALLAMGASGCADESFDDTLDGDDAEPQRAVAVVLELDRDIKGGRERTSLAARFAQAPLRNAEIATIALRSGSEPALPALGACAPAAELETGRPRAPRAIPTDPRVLLAKLRGVEPRERFDAVALLDAGDVHVLVEPAASDDDPALPSTATVELAPRAFASVGDEPGGMVYTSPDDATPLSLPARVRLVVRGSVDVEAATFEVDAPSALEGLRVAGELADETTIRLDGTANDPVALAWDRSTDPRDVVWLEARGATAWRCAYPDAGRAEVPRAALVADDDGRVALVVHRRSERALRRVAPTSETLGPAIGRFDAARTLTLLTPR